MKQTIFLLALLFSLGFLNKVSAQEADLYYNQTDNYVSHGVDIPQPTVNASPWLDDENGSTEGSPWVDAVGRTNPALYFILKTYNLLRRSVLTQNQGTKTSLPTARAATFHRTIE